MENNKNRNFDEVLTVEEVSCYLKVHRTTVSRIIKSGEIKSFKVGSRILILSESVKEFIDKGIADGIGQSRGTLMATAGIQIKKIERRQEKLCCLV